MKYSMAFINIYELYSSTLEEDRPYVSAILDVLKATITSNVTNNVMYFVFDLEPYFTEVPSEIQRNRIVDMVLFEMRNAGIQCRPVGVRITEEAMPHTFATPGYNSLQFAVKSIEVNIRIRSDREYMKSWC